MINSPFPNRVLSDKEKETEAYNFKMAEAIYSYYDSEQNPFINKSMSDKMALLRQYGSGSQPIEIYKDDFTFGVDNATSTRLGLSNINYEIIPFSPVIKNNVIEILNKRGTALNVEFLDQVSSEEKDNKKAELWYGKVSGDFEQGLYEGLGLEAPNKDFVPTSKKELDLYAAEGGVKLDHEITFEESLNYVFNYDVKWENYISPKAKEDYIDIGVSGTMVSINKSTKKIDIRLINPENIIIMNSSYYDYRDSEFFGEIIGVSLLDIIKGVKETTGKIITEEQLNEIVTKNGGTTAGVTSTDHLSNKYFGVDWFNSPKYSNTFISGFTANVLDFVYLSTDIDKSPIKKKKKVYIKEHLIKPNELKDNKIKKDEQGYYKVVFEEGKDIYIKVWRRCKWLIGTPIVYDYGLCFDQTRDEYDEPIAPFTVVRTQSKSIMDTIKRNLDQIQLDYLKIQNIKRNASPKWISIDVEGLADITMGGNKYKPSELIKIRRLEGVQYYKGKPSGLNVNRTHTDPIQEHDGGMGNFYNEIMQDLLFNIQMIQKNTGLNDVALSGTPNPEVGLGQSEMAMGAANNSVAHIYNAYKALKESTAYKVLMMLQMVAKSDKNSPYKQMLGNKMWDNVVSAANKDIRNVALRIVELPTQDEIQYIQSMIQIGLQGGKNGNAALTPDDALELTQMIKENTSLSLVRYMLKNKRESREKKQQEEAMAMMMAQQQEAQKLEAMRQEGGMQQQVVGKTMDAQIKSGLQQQQIDGQMQMQEKENINQ